MPRCNTTSADSAGVYPKSLDKDAGSYTKPYKYSIICNVIDIRTTAGDHISGARFPMSLEKALGPSEGRYFAAGYRQVKYVLQEQPDEAASLASICTKGRLIYPKDWSLNADGSMRPPHLSSVDAIILPTLVFERHINRSRWPHAAEGLYISGVELRSGNCPWLDVSEVPLRITIDNVPSHPAVRVTAEVGNIRSRLTFSPLGAGYSGREGRDVMLPTAQSVLGELVQKTDCQVRLDTIDLEQRSVEASISFTKDSLMSDSGPGGIEAEVWPAVTAVDYLVSMGQLTQALVYELSGLNRSSMSNLWMRSMSIKIPNSPASLPAELTTNTSLERDRLIERDGQRIHDLVVSSRASTGVQARASLAYTEGII